MTDEDKALLRQYEGAGGLGEADATMHGVLTEFYTPRNVVNKVWQLVDKYLPGRKNVLEPSAGTGRFAEDRPLDKFTLNELDDISGRIAGILNPDAELKHGAFQALFKPGKEYTGQKYDCVIGNPPYGTYAGLWKGKGEGAEHNRYEEYFIDRGLDTLRDGGIMAFVVSSGFLDGANDKIKTKIAEKGRLLEAWRLPNGVFNTTGVGTDIVIIRKEKGNAKSFSDGAYFNDNSTHILGDVTTRMNQFGKDQKYVALRQGDTFDGVIDGIPSGAVDVVLAGEKTATEQAKEKVRAKESEAEAHQNRSQAMIGNENAKKYGSELSGVLSTGKSEIVRNANLGDISIDAGETGKSGYGLKHIIEQRLVKDGLDEEKIAALVYLVRDALEIGKLAPDRVKGKNRRALEKNGVIAIVDKNAKGKFILTGYALNDKKEEATEAIQTVSAQYGYTPEFSDFRKQVGAVISSLSPVSFKTGGRSSVNAKFNTELDDYIAGRLPKNHVFKLGKPGDILSKIGFPADQPIELTASRLTEKAGNKDHPFDPAVLKDMVNAMNNPVAVFSYGNRMKGKDKAQNVIIEIQKDGKNFLVGVHFRQNHRGAEVSDIRGLFPKDNHEWLNWINQDKLLYADKEKLQAMVAQQRINAAEVDNPVASQRNNLTAADYLDMEPIERLLQNAGNVKDIFPGKSRSEAMRGNDNAAGSHNVDSAAEFNAKYNKHVAPEALPVWKATQWNGAINLNELDEKSKDYIEKSGNYVKQADGRWYSIVNFASGNIYDKLDKLEITKENLSKAEYERQKDILEKAMPVPKTVTEFEVSPLSEFAEKFETNETRFSHNGLNEKITLIEAFKQWITVTDSSKLAIGSEAMIKDILNYIDKRRVVAAPAPRGNIAKREAALAEAAQIIKERREAAERLFNQYIREELPLDDQKRLADTYNRQHNGTVTPDIDKIPLNIEGMSRVFKNEKDFKLNPSQLRLAKTAANQGNLIYAADVGVGKTVAGIVSAVNDLQTGRCKKPLIVVPKAVYTNWINEINQLFPDKKVNDLGNFSSIAKWKNADGSLNIEDGSISVITEEALYKITFNDETLNGDLREIFSEAISAERDGASQRKKAKNYENIMTKVGIASRTSGDRFINWEDTGFDHITVDEAHRFRNSFSQPKTKNPGDANEFKDVPGGSTSTKGLKLFAITQMIQKYNNGRNVHLLTATPFQNSPGEIYNMLSYVAREKLKEAGIENYHEFLTQFIELKSELSVDSKGNVTNKNVVKSFKNLAALQSLLNRYVMKIDGEDAGIIRPLKENHLIELNPTAEQRDITERIREYMESNPSPKKDPGATLRCLNALRQAALSPALVDGFEFLAGGGEINVKNKDFVKSSPKMSFVCDTAANLNKLNPDKGQIIHMGEGIKHFDDIKKALIKNGVPPKAIAIIRSGISNDKKDKITKSFNDPKSKVKIIIGGDTIIEGINLNGNTIQSYECTLGWNPTSFQQFVGRSHRQGNLNGMVHITVPLMNDSVDSFMYQKHDEKSSRLNAIFVSKENSMSVDDINPEDLKFALIKDPVKRADMQIKAEKSELSQKQKIAESTGDKIFTMSGDYIEYKTENAERKSTIESLKKAGTDFAAKSDDALKAEHKDLSDDKISGPHSYLYMYDNAVGSVRGKTMKEIRENYAKALKNNIADEQNGIQRNKGKMDTIANTLSRYGVSDPGNMTMVEKIRKNYVEQGLYYKARIDDIEAGREQRVAEAAAQIKADVKAGVSVDEAVMKNTKEVSENLFSMEERKRRLAASGEVKKALRIVIAKKITLRKSLVRELGL